VDDTYNHLIASGNTKDSVWWVITSVVLKEIFREYVAAARSTPTDINFDGHIYRASTYIWGTVRTDAATASLSKKGIHNHPSVVGAYSQRLVTNNGLKEALQACNDSRKVEGLLTTLKSTAVVEQGRVMVDLKGKVEAAKKVADKALSHNSRSGN